MMIYKWSPKQSVSCCAPSFADLFGWRRWDGDEEKDETYVASSNTWQPVTDIFEKEDSYVVRMEVPGFTQKDVNIEVNEDLLAVSGELKDENKTDSAKKSKDNGSAVSSDDCGCYLRTERRSGKFHRSFRLPRNVDAQKITAAMKDGVLELKVAKPEVQKPKNIPITWN